VEEAAIRRGFGISLLLESPLLPPPISKYKCHAERQRGISRIETESNDKEPDEKNVYKG
jgi:hypothetical protein